MAWQGWSGNEGPSDRGLDRRGGSPVPLILGLAVTAGIAAAALMWLTSDPAPPQVASPARPSMAPSPGTTAQKREEAVPASPAPTAPPRTSLTAPPSPAAPATTANRRSEEPPRPAPADTPSPALEPAPNPSAARPADPVPPTPQVPVTAPLTTSATRPASPPPISQTTPRPSAPEPPPFARPAAPPEPSAPPAVAAVGQVPNDEAVRLTVRAGALVKQGDIGGARLLLERAAVAQHAPAMFALAETYDPVLLASWGVRGIRPDIDRARGLYEQALAGGVPDARERLDRLR